jgi:hypothetical protein
MSYPYANGYIYMPVVIPAEKLPDTVEVAGSVLHKKSSFHVSLVCVKEIIPNYAKLGKKNDEELAHEILSSFAEYVEVYPVDFLGFRDEYRHAIRDGRESLVGCCDVSNLTGFFDVLNAKYAADIPYQPTHVTLYTLQPDMAIGISSPKQMASYDRIALPELRTILNP